MLLPIEWAVVMAHHTQHAYDTVARTHGSHGYGIKALVLEYANSYRWIFRDIVADNYFPCAYHPAW